MGTIIGIGGGNALAKEFNGLFLVSSATVLNADTEYALNLTSAYTVTLPLATEVGQKIRLTTVAGSGGLTNKVRIGRSTQLIDSVASDRQLIRLGESVTLTWIGGTVGWRSTDKKFATDFALFTSALVSRDEINTYLSPIQAASGEGLIVGSYSHGITAVASAYAGGVYSPSQNRIYLTPDAQSNQANWHYIDCSTGTVVAYAHGITAVASAYAGGVYSPSQNRIYLVPYAQSNQANWHYIDCSTGTVVAYVYGITAVASAYAGGVYSPSQNRIYLVPFAQSNQGTWHQIIMSSPLPVDIQIGAHPSFNKL